MARLRLIKARSYNGLVRATANAPFVDVDTDKDAQTLIATGYFEVCGKSVPSAGSPEVEDGGSPDYDALSAMTKAELMAYAESNSINIEDCKTKADILEAISVANGGSRTMIELQQ